jgi:hypothetical protein
LFGRAIVSSTKLEAKVIREYSRESVNKVHGSLAIVVLGP